MGKILVLVVLALAVVGGSIYFGVSSSGKSAAVEPPTQQLVHVREQAKKIEDDAQKRADDVAAKFGNAKQ